jgi:CheY-like chemotaxis protein
MAEEKKMKTVLLVEDEPLLGNLLRRRLEKEGFTITLARDGQEALDALKKGEFDLMLLDIILPRISGFELLEIINVDPQLSGKKVPVVVISNLGQESDIEKAKTLGVIGYFVKAQLSFEDLVKQIKDFFTKK